METEFIYWRHPTPAGIKVEEVTGADDKSGCVWLDMALQIYCENGRESYREIGHFPNGAPFLFNEQARISITHTDHFLAVATLPRTPEADLNGFNPRTAMGIDAEPWTREQVLRVRERFLSPAELELVPKDSLEANILAWTAKEAMYKAAFTSGLDIRNALVIRRLPAVEPMAYGEGEIILPDSSVVPMTLYSYSSEGHCVTLAFSPRCATFKKSGVR